MLNVTKYKDVIAKEKENNPHFDFMAVCDGKPVPCKEIVCNRCLFRESDCPIEFIKWLFTEHVELPTLNNREWGLLNFYEKGWIARERTGDLYVHQEKPAKRQTVSGALRWESDKSIHYISKAKSNNCFDFIQFEDNEPWSIEVLLAQCSNPNMTNYEYFKENIEEIHKTPGNKVAIDTETGIPIRCGDWNCEQCKFDYACQYNSETTYEIEFMKWLAERRSAE